VLTGNFSLRDKRLEKTRKRGENTTPTHVAEKNKTHIMCPTHFSGYLSVFEITEQQLLCAYVS
jgi:hypothetical protein